MNSNNKIIKSWVFTAGLLFASAFGIISCENKKDEKENPEKKDSSVFRQGRDYKINNRYYLISFKDETNKKFEENKLILDTLRTKVSDMKGDARVSYNKKIVELERKNSEMKIRLDEYKADGETHWDSFKSEFSHDMDELGIALRNLATNNVK